MDAVVDLSHNSQASRGPFPQRAYGTNLALKILRTVSGFTTNFTSWFPSHSGTIQSTWKVDSPTLSSPSLFHSSSAEVLVASFCQTVRVRLPPRATSKGNCATWPLWATVTCISPFSLRGSPVYVRSWTSVSCR